MTTTTPEGYLTESPWTGVRTIAVFLTWLVGGMVGGAVASLVGYHPLDTAAGLLIAIGFQSVAALGSVWWYSQAAGAGLDQTVGLMVKPREWYGILLGFALQWGVGLVLLPLIEALEIESEPQAITDLASESLGTPNRVWLFVSFVILAPLVEEVLFRGVMLGWLVKRLNRHVAVAITAIAFGLLHWEGPDVLLPVIGLVLIGFALGYVAVRRGNLSLAILMHAGINLLAFLVLIFEDRIVDWLDRIESDLAVVISWVTQLT